MIKAKEKEVLCYILKTMKKIGFDNKKYIRLQSQNIKKRVSQFNKLYLEFGGKLFDDNHASRVLPGFEPDSKIKMLLKLKDILVCPGLRGAPGCWPFLC